ncbi:MAG: ADP-ribosylglycohydrolase family protein [Methanoregulaceae archaeon]|nr:ADP-ribosylglycohydrolase family protein [Methanoregulaceae archaeon]
MTFISELMRAAGVLAGLAVGDALGAPLEGAGPPEKQLTEFIAGGRFPRSAGNYTDDTLQAVALAESIAACGGFCPEDVISRMITGFKRFPEYYGPTSGAVFRLVGEGVPPYRAAAMVHRSAGGSRTNGSVMRGAPVGVYYSGPSLEPISICCSKLTHFDPVAGACSAWLNRMVSDMVRGRSRTAAFAHARSRCRSPELIRKLGEYRRFDPKPGLDAVLCTHAAISCFMETRDFEEAVVKAINLGGDADTVGACCGALAGAFYGAGAIPARWISGLEDADAILSLGCRLWAAPGRE